MVQFSQAQPRAQFVRQGTVTVGGKTGVTRTVTESEVAQLLKKQQQLQQQKLASANVVQVRKMVVLVLLTRFFYCLLSFLLQGSSSGGTIHGLSPQVFAQAIQQASTSGTPVATLVKAVSSSSGGKLYI